MQSKNADHYTDRVQVGYKAKEKTSS